MKNTILENTLFVDNVSEALYQVIEEGTKAYSMLVCEIIGKDGEKYQAHIVVVRDEIDFVDNDEGMAEFGFDEEYLLTEL